MWGADMLLNINAKEPLIVIYNCYLSTKVFFYCTCVVLLIALHQIALESFMRKTCLAIQSNKTTHSSQLYPK